MNFDLDLKCQFSACAAHNVPLRAQAESELNMVTLPSEAAFLLLLTEYASCLGIIKSNLDKAPVSTVELGILHLYRHDGVRLTVAICLTSVGGEACCGFHL